DIITGLGGGERDAGARTLSDDVRRASRRSLIVEDYIMLGAFAVDQSHLNNLSFCSRQQGIDLTVNRAADTDEHHAAIGDSGPKCVTQPRHIAWSCRLRR